MMGPPRHHGLPPVALKSRRSAAEEDPLAGRGRATVGATALRPRIPTRSAAGAVVPWRGAAERRLSVAVRREPTV
jgi:hypothetical protein